MKKDYPTNCAPQYQWAKIMIDKIKFKKDSHIFDFGCAHGHITKELFDKAPLGITVGYDINAEAVTKANQDYAVFTYKYKGHDMYGKEGIIYAWEEKKLFLYRGGEISHLQNTPSLSFISTPHFFAQPSFYDIITSFSTLHWIKGDLTLKSYIRTFTEMLKPGGRAYLVFNAASDNHALQMAFNKIVYPRDSSYTLTLLNRMELINIVKDVLELNSVVESVKHALGFTSLSYEHEYKSVNYIFKDRTDFANWIYSWIPPELEEAIKNDWDRLPVENASADIFRILDATIDAYIKIVPLQADGSLLYTEHLHYLILKKAK